MLQKRYIATGYKNTNIQHNVKKNAYEIVSYLV